MTLADRIAALPKMPEALPQRVKKLPYLQATAQCIDCGSDVFGDWGLVPDRCNLCDMTAHHNYRYREGQALRARLDLAVAALEEYAGHFDDCKGTAGVLDTRCTCGLRAALAALKEA